MAITDSGNGARTPLVQLSRIENKNPSLCETNAGNGVAWGIRACPCCALTSLLRFPVKAGNDRCSELRVRGNCEMRKHQVDHAVELYTAALAEDPLDVPTSNNRAQVINVNLLMIGTLQTRAAIQPAMFGFVYGDDQFGTTF